MLRLHFLWSLSTLATGHLSADTHMRNTYVAITSCSSCCALQDPVPLELQLLFTKLHTLAFQHTMHKHTMQEYFHTIKKILFTAS